MGKIQRNLQQHFFTFGRGHQFWNRYVVIHADSTERAREMMFETFGNEWSMQYTEKEFRKAKSEGFFLNLESFPTIRA